MSQRNKSKDDMKFPPFGVLIVACMLILAGTVGLIYHAREYFEQSSLNGEEIVVLLIRILAMLCGILLLRRVRWARWLSVGWMAYHVVVSLFHPVSEVLVHLAFLILICTLLFLPKSTAFFKSKPVYTKSTHSD
ncbi:MAG: hypothetical protein ABWZ79_07160 [Pedobacter agri]